MSSISSVGSSSSNATAAVYQEMLARQLAAKQAANTNQEKAQSPAAPAPISDVDHDGDNH